MQKMTSKVLLTLSAMLSLGACHDRSATKIYSDDGDEINLVRVELFDSPVTEALLNRAGAETSKILSEASGSYKIIFHLNDDSETELFALEWSDQKIAKINWETIEDWESLGTADGGEFLSMNGSRPIAQFCGQSIESGLFGPNGSNRGYHEDFCRLMTSNSLPWDKVN